MGRNKGLEKHTWRFLVTLAKSRAFPPQKKRKKKKLSLLRVQFAGNSGQQLGKTALLKSMDSKLGYTTKSKYRGRPP